MLKLVCTDPEIEKKIANGGAPLIDLCRRTAEDFDKYLRGCDMPEYNEGLAKWEKEVCAGLLYQMYRGRLEPKDSPSDLPGSKEQSHGST